MDVLVLIRVRVDEGARTIVWPNGLDPDPEMPHDSPAPVAPAIAPISR